MTTKKQLPPQQLHEPVNRASNATGELHLPVLLGTVLELLSAKKGEKYLDLTAGYGGHARQVIAAIGDARLATLVDRDQNAINALDELAARGARVIKSDYATCAKQLSESGELFDLILLDLGVSSPQLDNPERGFSFSANGPLDMRMDQSADRTAADLVNTLKRDELITIIRNYGEEPQAARIADAIVASRPFQTTAQLAEVIAKVYRYRGGRRKTHPATQTFQALRIAVNRELEQLEQTLPLLPALLNPGGRVVIISFHSLEDRLVKRFFKEQQQAGLEATMQLVTKKPISGADEDVSNPRARSAKLRAAVKNKQEREVLP